MSVKKILERKERDDGNLWMYDEDINNMIRKFARAKDDSKYRLG